MSQTLLVECNEIKKRYNNPSNLTEEISAMSHTKLIEIIEIEIKLCTDKISSQDKTKTKHTRAFYFF